MKASIVTIGDELLIGQIIDTNSVFIGKYLNKKGIYIQEKRAIADNELDIINCLKEISKNSDLCIVSGGLGPTKDDITKKTICKIWNDKLEFRKPIGDYLSNLLIKYGYTPTPEHMEQANVPSSCKHLINLIGTAPAMILEKDECTFVFLPGVPAEVHHFFENDLNLWIDSILPKQKIIHKHICTYGCSESKIAETLQEFEDNLNPKFSLAYLPDYKLVRLRLSATISSADEDLESELEKEFKNLAKLVEDISLFYSDKSVMEELSSLLLNQNITISTAESCTSGLLASTLSSLSGSSQYFLGSIVAYDNKIKENLLKVKSEDLITFGAVSKPVVEQMALSICKQTNSTFSLSTSGIAGPTGGTPNKPVGTIWIGMSDGNNTWSKQVLFHSTRTQNIKQTVTVALVMLMKKIKDQDA